MGKSVQTALILMVVLLSGCLNYDFTRKINKQGNLLPDSKLEKLHTGMSKSEVAALMGTSLISPMFRTSRWDYVNTHQKVNYPVQVKTVIVYFKGDRLVKIDKDTKEIT